MRKFFGAISLLAALLATDAAQAHAFLDHADPLVGSTVETAPRVVTLTFSQKLEPAFSTVEITGPNGTRVDAGKAKVSGNTMRIGLKAGGAGTYRVRWHALSVDTHSTQGNFSFRVGGER